MLGIVARWPVADCRLLDQQWEEMPVPGDGQRPVIEVLERFDVENLPVGVTARARNGKKDKLLFI